MGGLKCKRLICHVQGNQRVVPAGKWSVVRTSMKKDKIEKVLQNLVV